MSQVNVNPTPPPPPRMPSRAPIYIFIALLVVLLLAGLALYVSRRAGVQGTAHPTATAVAATATARSGVGAIATATAVAGAATPTASGGSGATTSGPTPTAGAAQQPPTNPTALRVSSGSCTVYRIVWTWSGARRAASYDLVLYDPVSGNIIKNATTSATSYTLGANPGATAALKIRGRNAAGTAPNYYTPGGATIGRVPPTTTDPTAVTSTTTGHTINWAWSGAKHATAYDLTLYHYDGNAAHTDVTARVNQAHWSIAVTPGVTYHLKVRSVGACAPSVYYNAPASALAGATATPGGH